MRLPHDGRRHAVLVCLLLVWTLAGCKKRNPDTAAVQRPLAGPKDPDLRVEGGGYRGRHFSGPVYLPRASPLEDGTTGYDVVYEKGVTVLTREDGLRHLSAIHADGSYLFNATAVQVGRLKPGTIVLLSGLALRNVVDVQKTSTGYLLKTSPAKITDAIRSGRLQGKYKVDFGRMRNVAEYDVNFSGYNYHIKFTPAPDRLNIQATIKYAGPQGMLAYKGAGYLSNFVAVTRMQLEDGKVTHLDFLANNLAGQVNLKWYAAASDAMHPGSMARITSWPAELYKNASLAKAAYDIPIVLGALPMDLRVSLGFSFIPAFTSQRSVVEGSKLIKFGGAGGFNFADGQTKGAGSFSVDGAIDARDSAVSASGPVGFTAATEAPRLDLVLGWPPAPPAAAGYLNFVTSYGIVTGGTASPGPCQTNIMAFSVNAGAAYSSPNTFADWPGTEPGTASSVSLWSKTYRSAGLRTQMCPG